MSIWEGSGNVAALDVLRALAKEPEGLPAFLAECELARGADARFDAHLSRAREGAERLLDPTDARDPLERLAEGQFLARRIVEDLALALQASLLLRHAPAAVADGFCASASAAAATPTERCRSASTRARSSTARCRA